MFNRNSNTGNFNTVKPLIHPLLCISALWFIACDQQADYQIRDNINQNINLWNNEATLLNSHYLTNSTVTLTVTRSEGGGADGLEIKVSDPSLLKLLAEGQGVNLTPEATSEECVGDSCTLSSESDTDEGLKQTFAVQAPGVVTLTFFDDGKEVASQTVQLVDASRVTTSIEALMVAQNAEQELPLIAIGGRYQVLVDAYIKVDGKEEGLGIGGLIEMPTIEGEVSLSRTNWTQRLALNFEPTEAGESTVTLKLGGQDVRVNLKAIELDSITNLEVKHEAYGSTTRTDEDGDEIEVPLYQSNLSVLTAEESQVLGTVATWTAIDHPEFNSVTSSRLIYEYSESEMVAFEVKVGELVKEVLLPMNPNSSILYGEEIEGCNQANARTLPSLLLMMILVTHIVRRRWVV